MTPPAPTPEESRRVYDADPSQAIATMLAKMDAEDKHTFNQLIRTAHVRGREEMLWAFRHAHYRDCTGPGPCEGCTLIDRALRRPPSPREEGK